MIKDLSRFFRHLLSFTPLDVASAVVNGGFSLIVMTAKNHVVLHYGLRDSVIASLIMAAVKFAAGFFAMKPQAMIDERLKPGFARTAATALFYAAYQTTIFAVVVSFMEPLETLVVATEKTFALSLFIGPWVVNRVKQLGKWLGS